MPATQVSLIKGDSVDNNTEYRDSLPTNMFVIPREVLGTNGYLINWYGLANFATGEGVDRGAIWVSNADLEGHYRVSGNSLLSIDTDGAIDNLGDIPGSGQVSMDYSFNNLAIVADEKLFYYNKNDGLREISGVVDNGNNTPIGTSVGSPIDLVWVDGYFFVTDGDDIYHSDITNEERFLPLDFGNAQFLPDPSRGLGKNEDNEILVFGAFSIEYFINVGTENFAFQRLNQKAQKIGVLGTHCKREMNGKWYTLSRRKESAPSFHIISLGNEQVISTRETDQILSTYTHNQLASVTVDTMVRDNMKLVIYNLPDKTLMFNETIAEKMGIDNAWTILKTDVLGDLTYRAKDPILDPRSGKWIVGDKRGSTIGVLDASICTHYGEIAEWIIDTPFLKFDGKSITQIEIDTIPGISPDEDATVELSVTFNGRTHSQGRWVKMGANYDYGQRFILRNPVGFVRDMFSMRFRGASKTRMSLAKLNMVFI